MEISHKYAQNIVDKTTKILNKNINIMNSLGIIVGSGDRKRINTYHQGASKVNSFYNPQNMISYKGSDNFLIFYVINSENYLDIKQQIIQDIKIFDKRLKNSGNFEYCVGIGCYYPGISGLKKSYKEAVKAIRLREIYKVINKNVVFACDLALEMMLIDMPKHLYISYKHKVMAKCGVKNLLNQKKLLNTLNAFFDNNLNSSSTAEFLDITRNTVNNRLKTIKSMTGLDPKKFNDALKIKILLVLNEIETFN